MGRRRRRPRAAATPSASIESLAADFRTARQKSLAGKEDRLKVLRQYARRRPSGQIVRCRPSQRAVATDDPFELHSFGKVIFDTEEAAIAADIALQQLGYPHRVPYPCRRSRHGHHHLHTPKGNHG